MPADGPPLGLRWRGDIVACAVIVLWAVIALRLIWLQFFGSAASIRRTERQRSWVETLPARPGDILDRDGRLLATSIRTHSLALDPALCDDPDALAASLAQVLPLDASSLATRIRSAGDKRFLWVRRRLTPEEHQAVRSLQPAAAACFFREEFLRVSLQGAAAGHVLGARDIDGRGRGGVEQALDHILCGVSGRRTVLRDARGYIVQVEAASSTAPVHGRDVTLTIDSIIQNEVEQRLERLAEDCRPVGACAIVLDPRSGELLALASWSEPGAPSEPHGVGSDGPNPSDHWDADARAGASTEDSRSSSDVSEPSAEPLTSSPAPAPRMPSVALAGRNHAVQSSFEPGSTFKPLVVAWALDRGRILRDEIFDCEGGAYRMGRRLLHDHHPYGRLSLSDVLVKSSNIGMAKMGERLGLAELHAAASAFGFGRETGVELTGELPGKLRPLEDWTSYSLGSIPMGQELAATPLQVLSAHAALANDGILLAPHLVREIDTGRESAEHPAVLAREIVSAETAQWLVQGPLREVIERGTGKQARLPGYAVFGKSGTAQKLDPKTGGYSHSRHIASFVCGAPAEDPRALVLVMVDEPREGPSTFGGIVAAPAAADILRVTLDRLGVPPGSPDSATPTVRSASRR